MTDSMYRLRSRIDESLDLGFESFEAMQEYAQEHGISEDDAAMEEWIDDRINPELSGFKPIADDNQDDQWERDTAKDEGLESQYK